MKVLFYAFPGVLPQGPEFNSAWTTLLATLMTGLRGAGAADVFLLTGTRFQKVLTPEQLEAPVAFVDELALQHDALRGSRVFAGLTNFNRQVRASDETGMAAQGVLLKHVRRAVGRFRPDAVITFGMPADYLKRLWPATVIFHVEVSAFSRNPYPLSIFLDHAGIYRSAAHAAADRTSFESSPSARGLLKDFRDRKLQALAAHDPFASFEFRESYRRLVLLPLQVSNYYSFDEQCDFHTQFEYLLALLTAAPNDIGIITSEYVQWGEVLSRSGPTANIDWLRDRFPNLIFHEAFRNYDSVSQYLLRHVDGLFTVTSNLGMQALLHQKHLGTVERSFLGSLAHHTHARDLFRAVGKGVAPQNRDAFLQWYLERYAIPLKLLRDGTWLAEYLARRLRAIHAAQSPLAGFVPVDTMDTLRSCWLDPQEEQPPGRYETPRAVTWKQEALREVAALAAVERACSHTADSEQDKRPGYLLLNDTRAIEGFTHWGSSATTRFIERQMDSMGLVCLGRINEATECSRALETIARHRIRIVVLNGEGSVHHDSPRLMALMELCRTLHERGVPTVLVNTVWHGNTEQMGRLLKAFDLVAIRESVSHAAIRPWRSDARMVPDFTFAQYTHQVADAPTGSQSEGRDGIVVLDHVSAPAARQMARFAGMNGLPFYLMGPLHVDALIGETGSMWRRGVETYPRILADASVLWRYRGCVTGRYHGLVAALCSGVPCVALSSNTPKIEGMLQDIGLEGTRVLPPDWLDDNSASQLRRAEAVLARWSASDNAAVTAYRDRAASAIEALWRDIRALAARQVPGQTRHTAAESPRSGAATTGSELSSDLLAAHRLAPWVLEGFHGSEPWGVWSANPRSKVRIPVSEAALAAGVTLRVTMRCVAFIGVLPRCPVLTIAHGDKLLAIGAFRPETAERLSLQFALEARTLIEVLDLDFTDLDSPLASGLSTDARTLGFGIETLHVEAAEASRTSGSTFHALWQTTVAPTATGLPA